MRKIRTSGMLALLALPMIATAAHAQQRSGAWLVDVLRGQLLQRAQQAQVAHHEDEAAAWRGWADLYAKLAADPRVAQTDALAFARNGVQYNRTQQQVMLRNGMQPPADLYGASATMWDDLARQLENGSGEPQAKFPDRQMLTPIAGLAGTPWQDLGGHHAADCLVLKQRAQFCQSQLALTRQHDLATGGAGGIPEVMELRRCDAAQELYVSQCMDN